MWVQSLGQEDPLEKGMATRSSIHAWRIPWTEETGGLQSMGSQRVRHKLRWLSTHAQWTLHSHQIEWGSPYQSSEIYMKFTFHVNLNEKVRAEPCIACYFVCVCAQPCLTLCNPTDCSPQAPPSMGLPRQEYWSGLPFPSPGDLPDPGTEPMSIKSLHWHSDSLPLVPPGKPRMPFYAGGRRL